MTLVRTLGTLAACLAAGAAAAQTPPADAMKIRQVCAADIQKFCATVTPGHGAMVQCFKSHIMELSSGCRSALIARHDAERARKSGMTAAPST